MSIPVRAIASGNYSNTAIWSTGLLPPNGATIWLNGFVVTQDQNITIGGPSNPDNILATSIVAGAYYQITSSGTTNFIGIGAASNSAGTQFLATATTTGTGTVKAIATISNAANTAAGASAGGVLNNAASFSINANLRASTVAIYNISGTGAPTIAGNFTTGGGATSSHGVNCTLNSPGILSMTGVDCNGGSGSAAHGLLFSGSGSLEVTGNKLTAGSAGSHGISITAGNAVVNGNTIAASGSTAYGLNIGVGVTVSGFNGNTVIGSSISAAPAGIFCAGTINGTGSNTFTASTSAAMTFAGNACAANLTGQNIFIASTLSNAVTGGTLTTRFILNGERRDASNGVVAIFCPCVDLGQGATNAQYRMAAGTGTLTLYPPTYTEFGNPPAASDVRQGVTYGAGNGLTGTFSPTSPTATDIRAAVGLSQANLDVLLVAIKAQTDLLQTERLAAAATDATVAALLAAAASQ